MENNFKKIAGLVGDPTRAGILWTLLDGKAFTATELAISAGTSPQNISMHLSKLVEADLLCVESQGRHRYYKFSSKDIAYAIEALANLVPTHIAEKSQPAQEDSAIKYCRTCYDHLAGKVGVLLANSMLQQKIIIERKQSFELSSKGQKYFTGMGIDLDGLLQQRRQFLRPCLDWSERKHHMAGSLPAALLEKMLLSDWLRKTRNSRVIIVTAKGQRELYSQFKIQL
jgi:DNA-binding transcriptional ArsR family regulator